MGLGHWEEETERREMRRGVSILYIVGCNEVYDRERWLPFISVACCSMAKNTSGEKSIMLNFSHRNVRQ